MKFCFVILHYKTAEDTVSCIESINKLDGECSVVVVDNASNNGSIEKIEMAYGKQPNVMIIKNKENLGFATGNNVGYQYAREKLKANYITVSNNDIVIDTKDFIKKVKDLYADTEFCVAGPDIESLVDCKHQNPMKDIISEIRAVKKEIWRYRLLYFFSVLYVYDLLKKKSQINATITEEAVVKEVRKNVVLHGAFVIFSPAFTKNEESAFRPGTFLYMEESILFQYCKKKGYKTLFTPFIKVYHKEDSSTNTLFKGSKGKREFVFKNMIQSLKVYEKVLRH